MVSLEHEHKQNMHPPPPTPRKRLSSSALDCSKKTVCLVCRCISYDESGRPNDFFDIFVLDLPSDKDGVVPGDVGFKEFKPRNPNFRLDADRCFGAGAFCALGSTLYVFEGAYGDRRMGKSVAVLDLSSSKSGTLINVEPNMLVPVHDMLDPKLYPAALPTPDGKILIFSNLIIFDDRSATNIDFELYDPNNGTSLKLPQICPTLSKNESFWIEGFTLHEESSTFYIRARRHGMLCLDLSAPNEKGWVVPASFLGSHQIPGHSGVFFVMSDAELCFTAFGFFDMKRYANGGFAKCAWFPVDDFKGEHLTAAAAVPLGGDLRGTGEFVFCLVHTELDDTTMNPRLVVDVCRCNVKAFREDTTIRKILPKEILISFRFLLDGREYDSFSAYDMFAI